ncbi:MAG: type 1 glutamine amidotransferase [Gammaproteobacteria bacterium]|nr:type 1 glutamine amidotransferase [Gammaproteobacteria bacterium]
MKVGILEAGLLNDKLVDEFDPYPEMFASLLNRAGKDLDYHSFSVIRGQLPDSIEDCDGWLITGSRHGVYEDLDWMLKLEAFIREVYQARVPLVGICFGHQIVAKALGGVVVKSDKGWGVGVTGYSVVKTPCWMTSITDDIRIYAFHQDQVVSLPPGADIFLSSEFCPNAGLVYGDSVVSIQAHPEFEEAYELALLNMYSGNVVPQPIAEKALRWIDESGETADTQILAEWIVEFLSSRNRHS